MQGGGIPPQYGELEVTMEFKEGGAFDFSTTFDRLKERLRQAVDVAVESGHAEDGRGMAGVNMDSVHLDDLPAYEESQQHPVVRPSEAVPNPSMESDDARPAYAPPAAASSSPIPSPQQEMFQPPSEPPPGYEEVQRGSIADELERRVRTYE